MTVETFKDKLTQYFSWPYYGQWEGWALLTIAITALVLLLLAARAQAKSKD